ncbi:CLUMA_CG004182, isoform A [Clunio marinus]|uniref:CLUMA_CG004182, isoform A n=1 Tax=Clunio marinus TaxID=568069 RepID=A0A1J1HR82_9DIPT|nr:CLUMA_CG004182, isoform A [Clunio marinus]
MSEKPNATSRKFQTFNLKKNSLCEMLQMEIENMEEKSSAAQIQFPFHQKLVVVGLRDKQQQKVELREKSIFFPPPLELQWLHHTSSSSLPFFSVKRREK